MLGCGGIRCQLESLLRSKCHQVSVNSRSSAVWDPVVSEIPLLAQEDELLSQCKHTLEVGVGRLEKGLCALAGEQGLLCKCQSAPGGLLLWAVDYFSLC